MAKALSKSKSKSKSKSTSAISEATATEISAAIHALANAEIAKHSQRFFKTGPGEYGEGDQFVGVRVPDVRKIARRYRKTSLKETLLLLRSPIHEIRLCAVIMLTELYAKGDDQTKADVYRSYLKNTKFINNWDIVDSSAHKIVGPHLLDRDRSILFELAGSKKLWEQRIAIISTLHFIQSNQFDTTIKLCTFRLNDTEDLIHKACGWMLREAGLRDIRVLRSFLNTHAAQMPRTMLRYAIEKLDANERTKFMNRK